MAARFRRLLKTVGVLYLVFLAFVMMFWWKLPFQSVSVLNFGSTALNKSESFTTNATRIESIPAVAPTISMLKSNSFCDGRFTGYNRILAKLVNVIIDSSKSEGRRGGENISEVLNQPEHSEYHTLKKGYFNIQCHEKIGYSFHDKTHLGSWFESLQTSAEKIDVQKVVKGWTIAVQRYEYVNLYHTMTDYYNAFLVAKVFSMPTGNITILWIDGHPSGTLDIPWKILFGRTIRAGDIRKLTMFEKMVWGIMGYDSPINKHSNPTVPYIDEFKTFFLSRYGIDTKDKRQNCNRLNITFIWRRDYVAHPRNPSGSVSRKIKNEDELLSSARKTFQRDNIIGVQIDLLSMKDQLSIISTTDILVGMHGAGLSHTLFLPNHAGLIELYPTYWSNSNIHFKSMAKWRNLHYLSWINVDSTKELHGHYTVVDTGAIVNLMEQMRKTLCH